MTNEEFILLNRGADTSSLALKRAPDGVDLKYCLEQIKSRKKAERKLPDWAAVDGLVFPPLLSMEQCSSQFTAQYKRELLERVFDGGSRLGMVDLTAGFGVDFSYIAPLFECPVYVERQERLCSIAMNNMPLLGLERAKVCCTDGVEYLRDMEPVDLVFMDPARRDDVGRKTVLLEDCTPDVTALLPHLCAKARYVLLKLSPMLDIRSTLRKLPHVKEVHVVSVDGECRELLLLMEVGYEGEAVYYCMNLGGRNESFSVAESALGVPRIAASMEAYLYEPNASVLKAGVQDSLCGTFDVAKLHPNSNLFTASARQEGFPGREFRVLACHDFSKHSLKALFSQTRQANLTVRNFPATVEQLRKKLKLKEGGAMYLFATTLADGSHVLVQCEKV